MVTTLLLDTHRLVSKLKEHGFSEQQAEGIAEAIQEVDLASLATKADLKYELKELELRMTIKLGSLVIAGTGFLAMLKYFG